MTEPQFTSLEKQLVRASLQTKSDGEIAALIEKPIEDVIVLIDMITGGQAAARSEKIQAIKEEEYKAAQQKNARKELLQERKARTEKRMNEQKKLANHLEKRKKEVEQLHSQRKYKTREVNMDELVSVKIDHKTYVFVKPGTDIKKIKEQYTRKPLLDEN